MLSAAVTGDPRRQQRFQPTEAVRLALQIAAALDAAHARGILHRDLNPSNVLMTSAGVVKVVVR